MGKPSKAAMRAVHRENKTYPDRLAEQTDETGLIGSPMGSGSVPERVWRSRKFLVTLWREVDGFARLSVRRTEFNLDTGEPLEGITWDDLQRLKGEAGFGDVCAVEVYPPDGMVVNVANMRHLFLLSIVPPFVWGSRRK